MDIWSEQTLPTPLLTLSLGPLKQDLGIKPADINQPVSMQFWDLCYSCSLAFGNIQAACAFSRFVSSAGLFCGKSLQRVALSSGNGFWGCSPPAWFDPPWMGGCQLSGWPSDRGGHGGRKCFRICPLSIAPPLPSNLPTVVPLPLSSPLFLSLSFLSLPSSETLSPHRVKCRPTV